MPSDHITPQDLEQWRKLLVADILSLLKNRPVKPREWYQTYEILKLFNISASTLKTLRNNGTIPYSHLGGVFLYKYADIEQILHNNHSGYEDRRYKKSQNNKPVH